MTDSRAEGQSESQSQTPEPLAINPDLIRKYAEGASEWGITQLIALFDFQRRQMQRAEDLCRVAWDQVIKEAKVKGQTQDPGPRPEPSKPKAGPWVSKPKSRPTADALEIDLEL